ncbi:MAG: DUF2218 domain-containing protein [Propionicimonas sp.]|uniref:DUF2218 domain-containing protein n=1 Tax=Propionicimonas sp. TaxID=1955623 RepID=UPI003D0CD1A4
MTILSTGTVATDRPARYGKQLTAHLSRRHGGEWDEDAATGWINFGDGRAVLTTADGVLTITVDSPDEETAGRIEEVIERHLVRFATQDELAVSWARSA